VSFHNASQLVDMFEGNSVVELLHDHDFDPLVVVTSILERLEDGQSVVVVVKEM